MAGNNGRLFPPRPLSTTHAAMIGMNGHVANGLAAIFLACGQDVASVVESHASVINYEITEKGDLYASIKLPCLVIGTVGGGRLGNTKGMP